MARTFNCGVGMVAIVAPGDAAELTSTLNSAGEQVVTIGRVDAGTRGCTVTGAAGSWNSDDDWTASHDA